MMRKPVVMVTPDITRMNRTKKDKKKKKNRKKRKLKTREKHRWTQKEKKNWWKVRVRGGEGKKSIKGIERERERERII